MTPAPNDSQPTRTASNEGAGTEQPTRLLWLVLGLRSSLFLAEMIVGLRVHSLSLLAVAGHMTVDVLAIVIALSQLRSIVVEQINSTAIPIV